MFGPIAAATAGARARRSLLTAACLGLVGVAVLAMGARSGSGSVLGSSVLTRFDPYSVTFVSLDTGWALGTEPCASGACLTLLETSDAGHLWSTRPLPPALLASADRRIGGVSAAFNDVASLNVRFADRRDGWIYGQLEVATSNYKPTLWSTHDGGLIWREQSLRGLGLLDSIYDLEAAAGRVHLLESNAAYRMTVKSSPVGRDDWRVSNTTRLGLPAGGSEPSGAVVLHGHSGWLVEGNDRTTSGSARLDRDGRWISWTPPCASVGNGLAVLAASTTHNLVAVCDMGGFASPPPPGRQFGSWWLYFSGDAGTTFSSGPEIGPPRDFFGPIASPAPQVILIARGVFGGRQDLIASFDAGVHWKVVYTGQFVFLGFTSPKQGVGIVHSSRGNKMVMTFDGGDHWSAVTF